VIDPNAYLPLNNWGVLLVSLDDYDEALIKLQQAILRDPARVLAHGALGGLWEKLRNFEQATIAYERAFEIEPDNLNRLMRLGTALYRMKDRARAEARFNAALTRLADADVYNAWGDALLAAGEPKAARQRYHQALDAKPADVYAHTRIGRSWLAENKIDRAEAACKEAIEADEASSIGHVYCGDVFRAHRDRKTVEYYEQALALAPDNAAVLANLARHLYATGNPEHGAEAFQKALKINPANRITYISWGDWLLSEQDYNGALRMYDRSIRAYPANEDAYAARGLALQCLGQMRDAEKSQRTADAIRNRKAALTGPQGRSAMSMIEPYSRLHTPIPP
jgi:tetratricopeptide (TPR) repeat protein